ncbi:hypothetical protein CHI96_00005 [Proteus mirabilis]|uniref:lipase family protein n=1 Tax=Proteus mirabilis TaxID=584 RepID=UPI000BA063B9|nr:lipase family protein [Proteus mirabilis]MBG2925915.1 lipase family protein [Proteus mirabilis]OZS67717.1 hypothetical protein CHI96_00005 [Proteus mirabilis]HEK0602092.1 lipase family protein [Proteus mirabilis]HEK3141804.1 lipase family protein [Proteus mirabilis]
MSNYAFSDINDLICQLEHPNDISKEDLLRYICAMFSELSYYYIPKWELDKKKRAKLIPSNGYNLLIKEINEILDFKTIMRKFYDIKGGFEISTNKSVAIGIVAKDKLFIGIRGTVFMYDWKSNLRMKTAPVITHLVNDNCFISYSNMATIHFHEGFAYEATKLYPLIKKALKNKPEIKDIYICGHSLGGAVASILTELFKSDYHQENKYTIHPAYIFGAPRYATLSAYFNRTNMLPIQTRRPDDIVPILPPRFLGYIDHPCELLTDGTEYFDPKPYSGLFGNIFRWGKFLCDKIEPHKIENYRKDIGKSIKIDSKDLLLDVEKIKKEHLS